METPEFNTKLTELTTSLLNVVKEFIKDKPELVRRTGTKSNPDFKCFTTELHVAVLEGSIIVNTSYTSGGVGDPSNYQKTRVVGEYLNR